MEKQVTLKVFTDVGSTVPHKSDEVLRAQPESGILPNMDW